MKTITAIILFAVTTAAIASCPPGTAYRCYQGYNGKQICGCFRY